MNDKWSKDGARWNTADRIRVARRFRHHVRTPANPRGRIHREPCWFCIENALAGGWPKIEDLPPAAGHHLDYVHPFVVVWCCESHHRQIDHGSLRVPARAVFDYTSLIERPGVAKVGNRVEAAVLGLKGRKASEIVTRALKLFETKLKVAPKQPVPF